MKWKQLLAEYFSFTRKDLIGIALLIIAILIIFILPSYLPSSDTAPFPADTAWLAAIKSLEQENQPDIKNMDNRRFMPSYQAYKTREAKASGQLFNFDPNSLTSEGWTRLGLREKTIATILNYVGKGGRFRNPTDLQRIYGLFPDEYAWLAPYVKIPPMSPTTMNSKPDVKSRSPRDIEVDINQGDSSAFIALPGIGSKLANRIINFRDKLGGFYSISQVAETFGLPDSTFKKILPYLKITDNSFHRLNLNTASLEELKAHPYIRYTMANAIVAYRDQHGLFKEVADLKKLMIISEEQYNKIFPYLVTQ